MCCWKGGWDKTLYVWLCPPIKWPVWATGGRFSWAQLHGAKRKIYSCCFKGWIQADLQLGKNVSKIMPWWMVSLPGHQEAAEMNGSPSKYFLRFGHLFPACLLLFSLWFLAQLSSTCSEIPLGRYRALYKQEKKTSDPQKLKFAGNIRIGSAQHQRADAVRGGRWKKKKKKKKWSKCSRRPVVYGR